MQAPGPAIRPKAQGRPRAGEPSPSSPGLGSPRPAPGLVIALLVLALLAGCLGTPSGPGEASVGRTPLQILVEGAGPELYAAIDRDWLAVNSCWRARVDASLVRVRVVPASYRDRNGVGIFEYAGQYVYGLRVGNEVTVTPDLAALKHEFSHLVGEDKTGRPVGHDAGRCWL